MSNPGIVADVNQRIAAYQIALANKASSTRRVGPFYARFDPNNPNPFGNYAIPEPGATPSAAEVAALVAEYRKEKRKPRLEYIGAAAPAVEAALGAAGFTVEDRPAVMTCERGSHKQPQNPSEIELITPSSDADLLAVLTVQGQAFEDSTPVGPADVAGMRAGIERGLIVVLARAASGEAAGAGVCTPLEGGVTELAGIGVHTRFRRRGIAAALTARLAGEAFDRGATLAWMTPGAADAQRAYARAGFEPNGVMLMISLPDRTL